MPNKFKKQRFVSLSLGLSFIVMLISSFVLYSQPDRGVTAWSGWSLFAIDKEAWDNLHITLGLLFLVFLIWHIYYNWKPIKHYLKEKKRWVIFTKEFNASLLLIVVFVVGTLWMAFPLNMLVNVGNGIKAKHAKEHGTPPFLYAEQATLQDFIRINQMESQEVTLALKSHHILYNKQETLEKISSKNHLTPQALYRIIAQKSTQRFILPRSLPFGLAHETLENLNKKYQFNLKRYIAYLKNAYDIEVTKESKFKKITKEYGLHPATLYSMLLASQLP
jgi:uncharacterized membrane protein